MFNIGPLELVVLAFVGLVVLGPDRLPGLARDAARMIRTLRELANGARTQLRDELGPEFADLDLRSLNPRTAITQALLGDEIDPNSLRARNLVSKALLGNDGDLSELNPKTALQRMMDEPSPNGSAAANGTSGANGASGANGVSGANGNSAAAAASAPDIKPVTRPAPEQLGRGEAAPFDPDAT